MEEGNNANNTNNTNMSNNSTPLNPAEAAAQALTAASDTADGTSAGGSAGAGGGIGGNAAGGSDGGRTGGNGSGRKKWLIPAGAAAAVAVIGGGVIGMEFASFFNSMGTEVHVVEMLDKILGPMDRELSEMLQAEYAKRGVK